MDGRMEHTWVITHACMHNCAGVNKVACHPSALITVDTVIWGVYLQATTHVSLSLKHSGLAKKHLDLLKLLIMTPCDLPCSIFNKTISTSRWRSSFSKKHCDVCVYSYIYETDDVKQSILSSTCPPFSSFPAQPVINRRAPPYEPGPVQGFFLLKGCFSLPLLLGEGPALGFCEWPRDNFDYRRDFTSND